ncbi:MAG: methyltransferase protein [Candidatus Levybacteria bacterium]|nr:methyltransferase protein [Candidatus Levybacteria bacterium]
MDTLTYILNNYNLDKNQSKHELHRSRYRSLPRLFRKLGFKVGAEIGVEKGMYSKYLLARNPNLKLYSIDSWMPYGEFGFGKSADRQNRYYEEAKVRLAPYNCEIIRDYSMNAVKKFEDESLDFVYIDASHAYENVKNDIEMWSKKVRRNGIVAGDDYYVFKSGNDGVVRAVDEWVKKEKIKPLFIFTKDSRHFSWFYVRGKHV